MIYFLCVAIEGTVDITTLLSTVCIFNCEASSSLGAGSLIQQSSVSWFPVIRHLSKSVKRNISCMEDIEMISLS